MRGSYGRWVISGLVVVLACSTALLASSVPIRFDHNTSLYSYGVGGEFKATGVPAGDFNNQLKAILWPDFYKYELVPQASGVNVFGGDFQTFCGELQEYIALNHTYYAAVNDTFVFDTPVGPTPLQNTTAYLFEAWWTGSLTTANGFSYSYDYTPGSGRTQAARDLQKALWALQAGSSSGLSGRALAWYNDATGAAPPDTGRVYVLNVWSTANENLWDRDHKAQDMLIVAEKYFVPLPAAVWSGVAVLALLAAGRFLMRRA